MKFLGYRLGTVTVNDRQGASTITAYFVVEDHDESTNYMVTHVVTEKEQHFEQFFDEHKFLCNYGARLTYSLVWTAGWRGCEPKDIPEIKGWFPSYERWGC
jgi:hypothetical protein